MDQKHAMLYPPIEPGSNSMARDQRISASVAIGLPAEAPPSYDMAMATEPSPSSAGGGWKPSAPFSSPDIIFQPYIHNHDGTSSVIVDEPAMLPQIPHQQQPQQYFNQHDHQNQHQQQQQLPTIADATSLPLSPTKLGPNPCAVRCPACGTCKTTRMCYTPNSRTHLCALLLCLVGWCCCACFVPYCMNSCRTGNHYCSKCNTFLGTYNPRKDK